MEKIIKIRVKGGMVCDVEGLPEGYLYEIDDQDLKIEGSLEPTEEEVEEEFRNLLDKMSDDQFWEYVKTWKDTTVLVEQMYEWDIETKREAIKEIKKIIK